MLRLTCASALLLVLATGCGSGGDDSSDGSSAAKKAETPGASATPEQSYFERTDSDAINKAASAAQTALAKAYTDRTQKKCNAAGDQGYGAWRACWHSALDPVEQGLGGLSEEMQRLAGEDFPEKCVEELQAAAATFDDMGRKVSRLLTGIDSDQRAAQKKALKAYSRDLLAVGRGFTPVFRALTKVCYSPEDLASINASPSPSPSPSAED